MRGKFLRRKIGKEICSARKKRCLSQEKLSEKSDVDRTYISQIENGTRNPSIHVVSKLSRVLNLKFDDVLSSNNDKKTQAQKKRKLNKK